MVAQVFNLCWGTFRNRTYHTSTQL